MKTTTHPVSNSTSSIMPTLLALSKRKKLEIINILSRSMIDEEQKDVAATASKKQKYTTYKFSDAILSMSIPERKDFPTDIQDLIGIAPSVAIGRDYDERLEYLLNK